MMKGLLIIALVLATLYGVICIAIYSLQEKMIFPGPALPVDYSFFLPSGLEVEEVHLTSGEASLHGLYASAPQAKGVVLYFHGNGGSVQDWISVAPDFVRHQFDVLIMDYRGYGKSRGERTQELMLEDAELAYNFVLQKWPDKSIIVYGRSLGSGFGTYIASKYPAACLMLETPYFSLKKVSQDRFPWLPVGPLLRFPMPSHQYLEKVSCPIFMIHGTEDQVIPVIHSRLLEKVPKDKYVVYEEIPGGMHSNLSAYSQYEDWLHEGLSLIP